MCFEILTALVPEYLSGKKVMETKFLKGYVFPVKRS
jgi:hypothetical protein